ncbi:Hypothetical predicted protein [Podarcis lilfordi]|uniref:Uncharacterized protein n=1 Tax=Podarcis lilfordi TaxID=74358 RepID=A0AA35JU91_9SAUR|nr:Hypothetical predicted protein [Podarcis lilfordi]
MSGATAGTNLYSLSPSMQRKERSACTYRIMLRARIKHLPHDANTHSKGTFAGTIKQPWGLRAAANAIMA